MTLGQRQRIFAKKIGLLIAWAYTNGYELSFGDAARMDNKGHKKGSFHYKRLAIDLNLFIDGVYQRSTEAHRPLGEYWKSLGGTWGGDFRKKDGNHYSWGE